MNTGAVLDALALITRMEVDTTIDEVGNKLD